MAKRYAILGVEGEYDKFFIGELLIRNGFQSFDGKLTSLDVFWGALKPNWPKNGFLYGRPEMPQIVQKGDCSVAICGAEGANLLNQFPITFVNHPKYKTGVVAFGLIVDADMYPCSDTAEKYARAYRPHFPSFPDVPGVVDKTVVHTGIYVLPDNTVNGTLEDILLECGNVGYSDLAAKARSFLVAIDRNALSADDKKGLLKFAGEKKALISCMSGVLKPGLTIDNTIRKDRWFEPAALALPRVQALTEFLRELITF